MYVPPLFGCQNSWILGLWKYIFAFSPLIEKYCNGHAFSFKYLDYCGFSQSNFLLRFAFYTNCFRKACPKISQTTLYTHLACLLFLYGGIPGRRVLKKAWDVQTAEELMDVPPTGCLWTLTIPAVVLEIWPTLRATQFGFLVELQLLTPISSKPELHGVNCKEPCDLASDIKLCGSSPPHGISQVVLKPWSHWGRPFGNKAVVESLHWIIALSKTTFSLISTCFYW